MKKIEYNTLIKVLLYNSDTGIFTWIKKGSGITQGMQAGTLHHSGYRYIEINGVPYSEHRLAWYYCFQEWPSEQLDHIDRNRSNNSIDNLREVSNRLNQLNTNRQSKYGHNISANKDKFSVCFTLKGRKYRYGTYNLDIATKVRDFVHVNLINTLNMPSMDEVKEYINEKDSNN